VIHALERATQLMCEVGTGWWRPGAWMEYPGHTTPRLNSGVSRTNQVLGTEFSPEQMLHTAAASPSARLAWMQKTGCLQVPPFPGDLGAGGGPHRPRSPPGRV